MKSQTKLAPRYQLQGDPTNEYHLWEAEAVKDATGKMTRDVECVIRRVDKNGESHHNSEGFDSPPVQCYWHELTRVSAQTLAA